MRQRAVVVADKSVRVASFHRETVKALAELVAAAGLDHPQRAAPASLHAPRRADRVVTFAELYRFLAPGELLRGTQDDRFATAWHMASATIVRRGVRSFATDHAGGGRVGQRVFAYVLSVPLAT